MKRFTQMICLLLITAMLLATPVCAAEGVEPRASSFFTRHGAYLEVISSTKLEVWFDVFATGTMDELGAKTIKVQRSTDKSDWETVKTYKKDDYSQMICEDTYVHADCVTYSYTTGYYYRAYVVFYAKNSSGIGEYDYYTPTVDLRK